jgi:hypothetical protein
MPKRINIILPEATIRTLNRLAKPRERSRFIDNAVRHYAATRSTEALREQLKQAFLRDRDLEAATMAEWAAVDSEAWRNIEQPEGKAGRAAAKSTSPRSTRR